MSKFWFAILRINLILKTLLIVVYKAFLYIIFVQAIKLKKTNMGTNIITTAATTQDFKFIDQMISLETQRKTKRVSGSSDFGILTACMIDGEFICVTDYPITNEMRSDLEKA